MWDLPRPGLEPVSPALAGRFSTTAPPGKPTNNFLKLNKTSVFLMVPFVIYNSSGKLYQANLQPEVESRNTVGCFTQSYPFLLVPTTELMIVLNSPSCHMSGSACAGVEYIFPLHSCWGWPCEVFGQCIWNSESKPSETSYISSYLLGLLWATMRSPWLG